MCIRLYRDQVYKHWSIQTPALATAIFYASNIHTKHLFQGCSIWILSLWNNYGGVQLIQKHAGQLHSAH